jgi:hypothetical protein
VAIDAAGDFFSLLSLFFQRDLDIFGLVIYGTELVLWLGVFACGAVYNLPPWIRSRREQSKPQPVAEAVASEKGDPEIDGSNIESNNDPSNA